ncbi:MAG TPA: dihydrofolate reductase family protein [Pseudonocardiaceae bacterium]
MRSLVYLVATTLDGFIAGTDRGNPDFFPFDGPQAADLLAEFPEMLPGHVRGPLGLADRPNQRFDTALMGRTTYAIGADAGFPSPYPHLRQIVVSASLPRPPAPVEVIRDDVVARVRELKAQDGADIWLCGGGRLAASLVDEIDELILKVNPLVLGEGVPVFDGPVGPRRTELVGQRVYPDGYAVLRYRWSR